MGFFLGPESLVCILGQYFGTLAKQADILFLANGQINILGKLLYLLLNLVIYPNCFHSQPASVNVYTILKGFSDHSNRILVTLSSRK